MNKNAGTFELHHLLELLAATLSKRGYSDIRASHLGEFEGRRPPLIHWADTDVGYRPDLTARRNASQMLFQIESASTLGREETLRKIELFSRYALHYRRHFCLIVPSEDEEDARAIFRDLECDERFSHILTT